MKHFYLYPLILMLFSVNSFTMEQPAIKHIALHSFPRELQAIIASSAGDTLIEACSSIRSLACVNIPLNKTLKSETNTLSIIDSLAHRFNTTRLETALHLRTSGAHAWIKRCFAEDTNNEFAQVLSKKLISIAAGTHSLQSPISRKILQRVLSEGNYPPHIIEDFKRFHFSEESSEKYKVAAFLAKNFPSIINEKDPSDLHPNLHRTAVMIAIETSTPDIVALLLEAGADLPRWQWQIASCNLLHFWAPDLPAQVVIRCATIDCANSEISEMVKKTFQKPSAKA